MASTTAKLKPTESKKIIRAIAPETGGVQYLPVLIVRHEGLLNMEYTRTDGNI